MIIKCIWSLYLYIYIIFINSKIFSSISHQKDPFEAFSKNAKKGAPIKAVTIPIGNSAGDITILENVSANVKKAPPTSADKGIITLKLDLTVSQTICGITSPTKAINPLKDTATAVNRDDAVKTIK